MKLTHKNKAIKASSNKSANTLYDDIREEIWQFTSTLLSKEYEQYGITEEAPYIEGYYDIEEATDTLTKALIDYLDIQIEYGVKIKASTRSRRRSIKASNNTQSQFDVRTQFQSFLTKVDREVSNALYQYDDAIWNVKGTMSVDSEGYWFELNLWCDREEAGTVNITVDTNSNYRTATDAYVVTVPDTDEIQAEGNSFDDVYETCVGELLRLAEDYVNFVRDDRY